MQTCNPSALAAELRVRAAAASDPREREELLFLAEEYERLSGAFGEGERFFLPD
ncbi:hypothetical protein [Pelagerythrobacter sp.]|uniref:hypothetical protein n=1 Tax=Pelagerythrobacter sp. TaxID=2800702 RepID=UPI0035B2F236